MSDVQQRSISTLNELIRKSEGFDKKFSLKDIAERALRQIGARDAFPTNSVLHALLLGLSTKKPRLCEQCLDCLLAILKAQMISGSDVFDTLLTGPLSLGGKPVLVAVLERLADTLSIADAPVKQSVLDNIEVCVRDDRLPLTGGILLKPFQCVFNLHLTTTDPVLRSRTRSICELTFTHRVLQAFVNREVPPEQASVLPPMFSCTSDVPTLDFEGEPTEYCPIVVDPCEVPKPPADLSSCDSGTRDCILLLRTLCNIVVRPLPTSANTIQHVEVRTRDFGLSLIVLFFERLPAEVAWRSSLHYRSVVFLFTTLRKDLWNAIGSNLATVAPVSFFAQAMDILQSVCTKLHYFAQDDIYGFLTQVLFPMAKSKISNFQEKYAALQLAKAILQEPSLAVAYFINYDCNVHFADSRKLDGLLEPISMFVTELMFLQFEESSGHGCLTLDQQSLLREECVAVMQQFALGQFRWIAEEPASATAASCLSDVSSDEGSSENSHLAEAVQHWRLESNRADPLQSPRELALPARSCDNSEGEMPMSRGDSFVSGMSNVPIPDAGSRYASTQNASRRSRPRRVPSAMMGFFSETPYTGTTFTSSISTKKSLAKGLHDSTPTGSTAAPTCLTRKSSTHPQNPLRCGSGGHRLSIRR